MSTDASVNELDFETDMASQIMDAFRSAGMASATTYTDDAVTDAPVDAIIERAVQRIGEYGQVVGADDIASIVAGNIAAKRGGVLTVAAAGARAAESWKLEKLLKDDGAVAEWVLS